MAKQIIKLHFQNGLELNSFKKEVFDIEGLSDIFDFEDSATPDFIIFGPYGNDIPPKGSYTRIGYFCENIKPDLSICEWAFGVPREAEVNHPKYKRIQWHGTNPATLIKGADYDAKKIAAGKKHFCNFLYSHKVPYREEFFRQLSKYKKVDAPGKSMNNMPAIDTLYNGDVWQRKRRFLSDYKFTIAFENDIYPGYQTEKLYDVMQADSIPVYCGDPYIGEVFNTDSFINATDFIVSKKNSINGSLTRLGQMDYKDYIPGQLTGLKYRVKRKAKSTIRDFNRRLQLKNMDFSPLIEKIVELDTNAELYLQYLKQPWFNQNQIPVNASAKSRWMEIFNGR